MPAMRYVTAKVAPGKPGHVISPFDPRGRYVNVSVYTSGSGARSIFRKNRSGAVIENVTSQRKQLVCVGDTSLSQSLLNGSRSDSL